MSIVILIVSIVAALAAAAGAFFAGVQARAAQAANVAAAAQARRAAELANRADEREARAETRDVERRHDERAPRLTAQLKAGNLTLLDLVVQVESAARVGRLAFVLTGWSELEWPAGFKPVDTDESAGPETEVSGPFGANEPVIMPLTARDELAVCHLSPAAQLRVNITVTIAGESWPVLVPVTVDRLASQVVVQAIQTRLAGG